jgi:glycosyltransferase involved in cell wall biosynthesis
VSRPRVVIAHDFLVQRGGAERVVLAMHEAFPDAPIVTAVYSPEETYPAFAELDVRPLVVDRVRPFRRDHRKAFPVLAAVWSAARVDADVVLCSSAGWSHGVRASGGKLVYCYTPARWLYPFAEVRDDIAPLVRSLAHRAAPVFRAWDRRAAASADRYLGISTEVRRRIAEVYGVDAGLLFPPVALDPHGEQEPVPGVAPGYVVAVSRLLGYKNLDMVLDAMRWLPDERLVLVGSGPMRDRLAAAAPPNATMLGAVTDAQLRWLYANCRVLVAAGYEDFGLTALEAAAAGRPAVAIRWGGHLDTVAEGVTGVFAERPTGDDLAAAIRRALDTDWDVDVLRAHAASFGRERFVAALRAEVAAVGGRETHG